MGFSPGKHLGIPAHGASSRIGLAVSAGVFQQEPPGIIWFVISFPGWKRAITGGINPQFQWHPNFILLVYVRYPHHIPIAVGKLQILTPFSFDQPLKSKSDAGRTWNMRDQCRTWSAARLWRSDAWINTNSCDPPRWIIILSVVPQWGKSRSLGVHITPISLWWKWMFMVDISIILSNFTMVYGCLW